jgi:hypothetical protein
VTIMTDSSSDDWILLALRLQSLLITLNHNAFAILHTLQSLHTNLLCPNLYSTKLHSSLTAPSRTALVPIRFSAAHRLLISVHYGTIKGFQSHAKSSPADFFPRLSPTANCLLPTQLRCRVRVTLRLTVSQSGPSRCRAPSGAHDQILVTV